MDNFNEATPIALLTVNQLLSLLNSREQSSSTKSKESTLEGNNLIYGLSDLSKLLKSSKPTVAKLIKSGRISYVRTGRNFIFDAEKVLAELGFTKKTY